MEQFSIEKYLKNPSRKIVTRNGCAARILCTDRDYYNYPVVALVQTRLRQGQLREDPYCYTKDGLYLDHSEAPKDLFFAPEKKEGWINIYKIKSTVNPCISSGLQVHNTKEEAEAAKGNNTDYISTVKIQWEE